MLFTFAGSAKIRRKLYHASARFIAARNFARASLVELQNEMNRDSESESSADSVSPPSAPAGWSFKHPSGSNAILMGSHTEIKEQPKSSQDPPKISEIFVSLLAHFQSKDPSLQDPTLDCCEYIPFTARVYRPEKDTEMWIRYAYVNSSLKIIGLNFVPVANPGHKGHQRQAHPASRGIICLKNPVMRKSPWDPDLSLPAMVSLAETIRDSAYVGPQFRKGILNAEFQTQIQEYTSTVLGISDTLGEFIAQACYFHEQKEYERWLARISHFVEPNKDVSKNVDRL